MYFPLAAYALIDRELRRHKPTVTHIDTLTIATPKGRRRIRKILSIPTSTRLLGRGDALRARELAEQAETFNRPKVKQLKVKAVA